MKKRRLIYSLLVCFFACLFIFDNSNAVSAKEALKITEAPNIYPGGDPAGKIAFYDDYKIVFEYGYRVRNIQIWVCEKNTCNIDEPTIKPNQNYVNESQVEFDLSDYLKGRDDEIVTYEISASASFKYKENDYNESLAMLKYDLTINPLNMDDGYDKDVFKNSEKAINFIKTWAVPIIYIVTAIVFIVKAILLSIDLVRYSDNREVRHEKIRGFTFLFIGLLAVSIINTSVGFIVGLFG